jgi:hypothetical protein
MSNTISLTLAALAAALLFSSCSSSSETDAAKPSGSVSIDTEVPTPISQPQPTVPAPQETAVQAEAATQAAVDAFKAWARPTLDYDTWWAELKPHLSPEAEEAYAYTDPRNIPKIDVTGEPTLGAEEHDGRGTILTVTLPTSVGTFGVQMIRGEGDGGMDSRWRLLKLQFPPGLH